MTAPTTPAASVAGSPQLPAFLQQSKAEIHNKFVDLEWQQRNRLLQGTQQPANDVAPPSQWSRLTGEAVTARNRYMNVEPYAQNRIKLKVADGISDYINASPIQLGKRRYIATQGPKDTSVNHFYRMLADEGIVASPVVVVMLTQTHEAGREKCFQYYPLSVEESPLVIQPDEVEEGVEDVFKGEVGLESMEEDAKSRSEVRRLRLRTEGTTADGQAVTQEKEIHHLLFSAWPDFLIPEGDDRQALIELIQLSAHLNQPSPPTTKSQTQPNGASSAANDYTATDQANPRIIHCSAGVGRSGTFIALDYLLSLMHTGQLDNLQPADRDPIAETVDLLRQQRMMMVQGEAQFHFVYDVLRERYLARLAAAEAGAGGGVAAHGDARDARRDAVGGAAGDGA
ncbi:hypothetical protein LTR36_007570 [Oleoguttula mirabilis]|uniref:Uncharacterized protein n=1 Tax=Oleoguttula mirabilis TaxID=1507867 RepID=A0AAV9JUA8_9PEZI|nr:hypothetical protein LTR36_007570 [Oleoguttula mirabilis]